jgi:hypothetical protein
LITRHHVKGDADSRAVYSDDECHRYALTRRWGAAAAVLFVMLNPSTATELRNDPTIERCERRARALGFGAVSIGNLFGFRATDPKALRFAADPVGPDNDAVLLGLADQAGMILCAWGLHGTLHGRDAVVQAALRVRGHALHHLGLTRHGIPRHPLYLPYTSQPVVWP